MLTIATFSAQTHELQTTMAGQIARALSVFCVDEVVVFYDGTPIASNTNAKGVPDLATDYTGKSDPDHFLIYLLSYMETPPHLRKLLFPFHPNLRFQGQLPSLDLPHHLRPDEWCPYREGVSLPSEGIVLDNTQVQAGLRIPVSVDADIPPQTRVTLKFDESAEAANASHARTINASAVHPAMPREESGYYWGYTVRHATSLSAVFEECPFDGGYDLSIGTSERGCHIEELYKEGETQHVGRFNHLLIVIGGVAGLEFALQNDRVFSNLGVTNVQDIFDRWINVCPGQGSRTIRTEEAIWTSLMGLRRLVENNN